MDNDKIVSLLCKIKTLYKNNKLEYQYRWADESITGLLGIEFIFSENSILLTCGFFVLYVVIKNKYAGEKVVLSLSKEDFGNNYNKLEPFLQQMSPKSRLWADIHNPSGSYKKMNDYMSVINKIDKKLEEIRIKQ